MEEVDKVRAADSTLAAHYADLGILRPAVLRSDEMDYASFRQGARIVWTSQPIRVAAGELVLEDRAGNKVRARCGNRLSELPQLPAMPLPPEMAREVPSITFPDEAPFLPAVPVEQATFPVPPLVAFIPPQEELPVLTSPITPESSIPASPARGPFIPIIPVLFPFPGGGSYAPSAPFLPIPAHTPVLAIGPLVTPEPGTFWLLALALCGIFFLPRKMSRT